MNNKPMNGEQIAKHIGITRQAVSYSMRKSMDKMYYYVLNKYADTPTEAVVALMRVLGVEAGTVEDISEFISYFNNDIMDDIKLDIQKTYKSPWQQLTARG